MRRCSLARLAALSLAAAALHASSFAQSPGQPPAPAAATTEPDSAPYAAPRNALGQPDFEGVWTADFFLPLEAAAPTPLTLPEPAAKMMFNTILNMLRTIPAIAIDPEVIPGLEVSNGLAIVRGQRRTRMIVEPASGRLPYTAEVRAESDATRLTGDLGGTDNPEERPNWERCVALFAQPPVLSVDPANPRNIVQTADHVVIHTEYGDEARIIPYADKHRPAIFHGALGDAIARWEGETLVIETIGMPEKDRVRGFNALIVPATARVIERYTRIADNEMLYQFTVEDPSVYTAPWLGELSLYRSEHPMYPFTCHEHNYSLPSIMIAARLDETRK